MDVSVQRQTSGLQSHHGSVLFWSAPSLAGGSFSPEQPSNHSILRDQNAPAISLPSELRPTQLPIALEVFSDVCWGHPSQKGTAASLLLQASVPACSHVSSLCQDQEPPPPLPLVWNVLPSLVSRTVLACQFMGGKCPQIPLSCSS